MVKPRRSGAPSPSMLLHRAARVISGMAAEIKRSEMVDGKWGSGGCLGAAGARRSVRSRHRAAAAGEDAPGSRRIILG